MRTREKSLHLRLTEKEYAQLMNNCRKCGLKPQAYILTLIQNIQPKERPAADFFEVLNKLRWIGNNLRHLAIIANMAGSVDGEQYWKNVYELYKVVSDLKDFTTK